MAGGIHPGPQTRSLIMPKNHMFPRLFKAIDAYHAEPFVYNAKVFTRHVGKWGYSYALLGIAAATTATFMCEWRYVLRHIPLINWQYKDENSN